MKVSGKQLAQARHFGRVALAVTTTATILKSDATCDVRAGARRFTSGEPCLWRAGSEGVNWAVWRRGAETLCRRVPCTCPCCPVFTQLSKVSTPHLCFELGVLGQARQRGHSCAVVGRLVVHGSRHDDRHAPVANINMRKNLRSENISEGLSPKVFPSCCPHL